MRELLKTYEQALQFTNAQIAEIEEKLSKTRRTEEIHRLRRKMQIATEQKFDIVISLNEIKTYIEERGL